MLETACEYIEELNEMSTQFSQLKLSKESLGMSAVPLMFLFFTSICGKKLVCFYHSEIGWIKNIVISYHYSNLFTDK